MTRVDFYILADSALESRLSFACRLIDKIWKRGHDIYIHVPDLISAELVDQLLWEEKPDSFIPHSIRHDQPKNHEQIEIGYGNDPGSHHDVMINLGTDIPEFFSRFERVAEIVCQEKGMLETSRLNWKFYQSRGYPLESHKIN
ncbi:MAG: DNA polymerase III subunit chi [Pseudomonadales bacterium]|nr:DNA polymerase III subunit chi [Pseudomonadales bacterium]